jgi:L-ascorbate metabolism protein UlaG (beta-lactamase superfamily)
MLPGAMDPRQAAEAAAILEPGEAVPIHYDVINRPPVYAQVDRPAEAFAEAAAQRGVPARVIGPGEDVAPLSLVSEPRRA